MQKIINLFKQFWPILTILGVVVVLFLANFKPNTFLIGWDNLTTELNPLLNIKRALFSVWEEYQGLGLLAGNAHAADLPRQVLLLPLSFILPMNLIRQFYVFSMLLIGTFGAYFLLEKIIFVKGKNQIYSLMGALFYLLNLATIQTFYVPFEPFITHFAFLPWLLLIPVLVLRYPTKKNYLFFILINLLAIPQAQVPTVFVVYLLSLIILLTQINLQLKNEIIFKRTLKLFVIIFTLNSFWLLPFIYFFLTNSSVAFLAKINQMGTETVFLQNKAFGDIQNTALLKGFWFNNVDLDINGNYNFMMTVWKIHLANIFIEIIGYLFFLIILVSAFLSLKAKRVVYLSFFVLLIFSFTMLTIATPPFSWIDEILRKLPLFSQIFRFTFTKFSILASLCYAVFFALGIRIVIEKLSYYKKQFFGKSFIVIICVLIFSFSFPAFTGHLFYSKEQITLPKEYLQTFAFFDRQNPNTRIANFPQYSYWGWNYYNWGYGGSGFIWHGIKQPILDRAFDVWSKNDENYYWEIMEAVSSKDPVSFKNVLSKYQINWLLIDKNVINPSSPQSLMTSETEDLIKQTPDIKIAAVFGKIEIYKVNKEQSFTYLAPILPTTNAYNWNDQDQTFKALGNYAVSTNPDIYYPFRSLFSNKEQADKEYNLSQNENELIFTNPLPQSQTPLILNLPSFGDTETIVPFYLVSNLNPDGTLTVFAMIKTPQISVVNNGLKTDLNAPAVIKSLFTLPSNSDLNNLKMSVNGADNLSLKDNLNTGKAISFLSLQTNNLIILENDKNSTSFSLSSSELKQSLGQQKQIVLPQIQKNSLLKITIPKLFNQFLGAKITTKDLLKTSVNCDNFNKGSISSLINNQNLLELKAINANNCVSYYIGDILHEQSYAIFTKNINQTGRPLKVWLGNENEKNSVIDTYLPTNSKSNESQLVIPPQESFGRGYSLHFENASIGKDPTINSLSETDLYPIPYNYIISLNLTQKKQSELKSTDLTATPNSHPNESLYLINFKELKNNSTLILSQSFDTGWKAYQVKNFNFFSMSFPFIFGKEIKNHLLVNNWENGWEINSAEINNQQSKIIIVYLPQYLEYLGFVILGMMIFAAILRLIRAQKQPVNLTLKNKIDSIQR